MARDPADLDPMGLIRESYRIDGIGVAECRSIFLDWAISNDAYDLVKDGIEFCEAVALPAISIAAQRAPASAESLT